MTSRSQLTREQELGFNRIVRRALFLPIGVMVVASVVLAWLVSHLLTVTNWVDHTDKVIGDAQNCERLVLDMQTAMRGYLLTGNPQALQSFHQIEEEIAPAFDGLGQDVGDNPPQVEKVKTIRSKYGPWLSYADELITRREQGTDSKASPPMPGKWS